MGLKMQTKDDEIFLTFERYHRTVAGLADLFLKTPESCPFGAGSPAARLWLENEIKIVLGEAGNIWPLTIYGELVIDALEHARPQHGSEH